MPSFIIIIVTALIAASMVLRSQPGTLARLQRQPAYVRSRLLLTMLLVIVIAIGTTFVSIADVSASGDTSVSTVDSIMVVPPPASPPVAPPAYPDAVTGTVYKDFDADGERDPLEPGVGNVTVTLYAVSGAVLSTTVTADDGTYSFNIANAAVRVEFTDIPDYLYSGPEGPDSETTVAFATVSGGSNVVDLAVATPLDYCQTDPFLATPFFHNGDPLAGGNSATQSALVAFPYTASGATDVETQLAEASEVGAVYGLAFQRTSQTLFAGAMMKRHSGLGPLGIGGIYAIDRATSNVTQFIDLTTLGINTGTDPRTLPDEDILTRNIGDPNYDPGAFDAVGRVGLGDLEMSESDDILYLTNLFDRRLYALDVGFGPTPPTTYTAYDIPDPGCSGTNEYVPWAIKVHDGQVYVGVVCTAETSQSRNDLQAYILAIDPDDASPTFTTVFNMALDYQRGYISRSVADAPAAWLPWIDDWSDMGPTLYPNTPGNGPWGQTSYPQPLLVDIEFDIDGSMVLGFVDRAGHQLGNENYSTNIGDLATHEGAVAGDILRVCKDTGGTYELENNGSCGGLTSGGANNGQGPGGGEYYWQDMYGLSTNRNSGTHQEATLGGLALFPGTGETAVIAYDPVSQYRAGGIMWFNNTTGNRDDNYQVFSRDEGGQPATFGKAAGLGDLEILCDAAPVELGNRVWLDEDGDGIQDPGEAPISGVKVVLYLAGTPVATATTDSEGTYYFMGEEHPKSGGSPDADYTDNYGIAPKIAISTTYEIRVDMTQSAVATYSLTAADQGAVDLRDSDAVQSGSSAVINFNTGLPGQNDHTYDIGFIEGLSLGNQVWFDADNDGLLNNGETGINGVEIELYVQGDVPGTDAPLNTTTTSGNGNYIFGGLNPGDYFVFIPADQFNSGEPLEGLGSSTTTAADPDSPTDVNDDDNGDNDESDGVQSGVTTLALASEPTDDGDTNSYTNLTVDFGFYPEIPLGLGDIVWFDRDNSGTLNGTEQGISDVVVELYSSSQTPGVDTPFKSTTTNGSGYYYFSSEIPGDYIVYIPGSEFDPGEPLNGLTSSTGNNVSGQAPDPDDDTNNDDNGDLENGTDTGNGVVAKAVTLSVGTEPTGDGTQTGVSDNNSNLTVDFGFIEMVSLGNLVWEDSDNDGNFDPADGEQGIVGVDVELYDSSDNLIDTTSTDSDGKYLFENLLPGDYYVLIPAAEFGAGQPLDSMISSDGNSPASDPDDDVNDDDDGDDNEADGVQSGVVTLNPNSEPVGDGDASANSNLTVDFGFYFALDIDLTKEVNPGIANPGDTVVYTYTIHNSGQLTLTNLALNDDQLGNISLGGSGTFQQDSSSNNLVVIEAENYHATYPGTTFPTKNWVVTTSPATPSGGQALWTTDDGNSNTNGVNPFNELVRLEYAVNFVTTGDHTVWIRGATPDGDDSNSIYVHLDNSTGNKAIRIDDAVNNVWSWTKDDQNSANDIEVNVPSIGVHTFTIWMREDGAYIDKIVLTPDTTGYTPTGTGPVESCRTDSTCELAPGATHVVTQSYTIQALDLPLTNIAVVSGTRGAKTVTDTDNATVYDKIDYDFGDLPDNDDGDILPSYPTNLTNGGEGEAARHIVNAGDPVLGSAVDYDTNGFPSSDASGDDSDGSDDEDGVTFLDPLIPGRTAQIEVTLSGSGGYLSAFFDWDGDGTLDPVTAVSASGGVTPGVIGDMHLNNVGTYQLTISVPTTATGVIPARFRVTRVSGQGGNSPVGEAASGEIEDYILASVGDIVWEDRDRDGEQDDGTDSGVNGVVVRLLDNSGTAINDAAGNAITTTTTAHPDTGNPGWYEFPGLPPGDYQVEFVKPTEFDDFTSKDNTGDANDSDAYQNTDANPGRTDTITLTAGEHNPDVDAGLTITRYDFGDLPDPNYPTLLTNDGARHEIVVGVYLGAGVDDETDGQPSIGADGDDATDNPDDEDGITFDTPIIAGEVATITVTSTGGVLNAWMDFNGNGTLEASEQIFSDESIAGTQTLTFTASASGVADTLYSRFRFTQNTGEGGDSTTGPADSGEVEDYVLMSLGDTVWEDSNNNGQIDGTESGIEDVVVNLVLDSAPTTVIATTTTDVNGNYIFTGLNPGDYRVILPGSNFDTGGELEHHISSTPTEALPNDNVDNNDNGVDVVDYVTNGVSSGVVSLNPNAEPTGDGNGSFSNMTVDFGVFQPLRLGNRVWEDSNNNGIMDGGESGIDGVEVVLYDVSSTPVATMTTVNGGYYTFTNLISGTYVVELTAANFATGVLQNYVSSTDNEVNGTDGDADDNGIDQVDPAVTGIRSGSIALTNDNEPTGEAEESAAEWYDDNSNLTVDFGVFRPVRLGNRVWFDANNNGQMDTNEQGIANVEMWLLDSGGTPVPDGFGNPITTTTDTDGYYLFSNIPAGTYTVAVTRTNFTALGDPLYQFFSSTFTGGDPDTDADDEDDNGIDDATPETNDIVSDPVTVTAGSEPVGEDGEDGALPDDDSNLTVDFGFFRRFAIGNLIWNDDGTGGGVADDGLVNGTEPGLPGVTVNLYVDDDGTSGFSAGDTLTATTTTDSNGFYGFSDLMPDDYIVVVAPANFSGSGVLADYGSSTGDGGNNDTNDNDNGIDPADYADGVASYPVRIESSPSEPTNDDDGLTPGSNRTNLSVDFGFVQSNTDYGDLPDSYGTIDTSSGASHTLDGVTFLGASVDAERDGQPSVGANGDDLNPTGADDEDGVVFNTPVMAGQQYTITVTAGGTGYLNAWIDFNGNGQFDDPAERIISEQFLAAGTHDINLTAPGTITPDTLYSRFRFTQSIGQGNSPTGSAPNGEVEDYVLMNLGDVVFFDNGAGGTRINDGLQEGPEPGIPGVTVELYPYGVDPNTNPPLATTTTGPDGSYIFTGLWPGDYMVHIPGTEFASGGTLHNYLSSSDASDVQGNPTAGDDNGIDPTNYADGVSTGLVELVAGGELSTDGNDENGNLTVGFGFVAYDFGDLPDGPYPTLVANNGARHVYSDTVYLGSTVDTETDGFPGNNADGDDGDNTDDEDGITFDTAIMPGEVATITVEASVDGFLNAWIDFNNNGYAEDAGEQIFVDRALVAGTQTITFTAPANVANVLYSRFRFTSQTTGGTLRLDDIAYDGEVEDYVLMSLGDTVWFDDDENGQINGGESGVQGVTVTLVISGTTTPIATTTTDSSGNYLFTGVISGSYQVIVAAENFADSGRLAGYLSSPPTFDADDNADDDDNGINSLTPATNGISSGGVTLTPGSEPDGGYSNLRVDFGFYQPDADWGDLPDGYNTSDTADGPRHLITDTLHFGGSVDAENSGFPGIGADGDDGNNTDDEDGIEFPNPLMRNSTTTISMTTFVASGSGPAYYGAWIDFNGDGSFGTGEFFTGTAANGEQAVSITVPDVIISDTIYSRFRVSFDQNEVNAIDNYDGLAYSGEVEDYVLMSLGNQVWFDADNSGDINSESGLQGITVTLVISGTTTPIATATTDTGGYYTFTGIAEGDYQVILPAENFQPGGNAEGYLSSTGADTGDATDDNDNGLDQINPAITGISSSGFTMELGNEPDGTDGNGPNSNLTIDFGLYQPDTDWGDLPDGYNTSDTAGGPRHVITDTLYFGQGVDEEPDGFPTDSALGDDSDNTGNNTGAATADDEDGIVFMSPLMAGSTSTISITTYVPSGTAYYGAWIDFDGNGSFGSTEFFTGTTTGGEVTFNVTPVVVSDVVYSRFRLSYTEDEVHQLDDYDGLAYSGEVEDYVLMSVGNQVWLDEDNSGTINNGESGIQGVTVTLVYSGTNTPVAVTTTDATGHYTFTGVTPGDYQIIIPVENFQPGGELEGRRNSSGADTGDTGDDNDNGIDDPDYLTDGISSGGFTLTPGTEPDGTDGNGPNSNTTIDFGFYDLVSLGNRVWLDSDNSGDINGVEGGIDNVIVHLYDAADITTPVMTDTTTGGGYYLFDNLEPGSYVVRIAPDNFTGTGNLAGLISSSGLAQEADPETGGDSNDNGLDDVDPATNGIWSDTVILVANSEPITETDTETGVVHGSVDNNDSNLTVDFGFTPAVAIGNIVWLDDGGTIGTADNGIMDGDEAGINGVEVQLYNASNTLVLTTTTSGGGYYFFDNLIPGQYYVQIPASEFAAAEPLEDYVSSADVAAKDETTDHTGDENGIDDVNFLTNGIRSQMFDLQPDSEATGENQTGYSGTLDDDNVNGTADFGFVSAVAIGNMVWLDNGTGTGGVADDGIMNGSEAGIDGVEVQLYDITNTLVATTTTTNGVYYFDNLNPGEYYIHIPASEFTSTGPLAGYTSSSGAGGDDTNDENADENGIDDLDPATNGISSEVYDLQPGDEPDTDDQSDYSGTLPDNSVNFTADFGFTAAVAIGNTVWFDTDNDGIKDGSEAGVDGVEVQLYNASNTLVMTTTTNISGTYVFDNLNPGQYTIHIPASEFGPGQPLDGYSSTTGAGNDESTDHLGAGGDENGIDNLYPATNGISSQAYTLEPGNESTSDNDTGYSGTLPDNSVNFTADFGFHNEKVAIGNIVWIDNGAGGGTPNDGIMNGSETGIANVEVQLYTSAGTLVMTTTTNISGTYFFDDLEPWQYYVHIPASEFASGQELDGYSSSTGTGSDETSDENADENGVDDADPATNGISSQVYDLQPNTEATGEGQLNYTGTLDDDNVNFTADFGFHNSKVAIGNVVWNDNGAGVGTAGNGVQNGSEPGINGVVVELYDITDTLVATTTTATDGYYFFDNLTPGDYYVHIPATEFAAGEPLNEFVSSEGEVNDETTNADDNGIDDVDYLTNGISSQTYTLQPYTEVAGEPQNGYSGTLADNSVNATADFGFVQPVAIGNVVWFDNGVGGGTPNNGVKDGLEAGVNGVDVLLFENGVPVTGTPVATTTTNANGVYVFDNLPPGEYYVHIPASEFAAGQLLADYISSDGATNDETTDNDDNGIDNVNPAGNGISTQVYDLQPDTEVTGEDEVAYTGTLDDNNVNFTADLGFVRPALEINKSVNVARVVPNQTVTYTISITNTGDVTLNPIVVTDTMDPGLIYQTGTANPATGFTDNGQQLLWNLTGGLAPGATTQVTFLADVTTTIGIYQNFVVVEGVYPTGSITDTDDVSVLIEDPSVAIDKDVVAPGVVDGVITFTIRITNTGPSTLEQIPLFDHFTGPIEYLRGYPEPNDVDNTNGTLSWDDLTQSGVNGFGRNLDPNEVFTITTVFRLTTTGQQFSMTNEATVTSASGDPATDVLNNETNEPSDQVELVNEPTAISLLYFEGDRVGDNVVLNWATAIEINNFGFKLMRSTTEHFIDAVEIAFMNGLGSDTASGATYTYTDNNVEADQAYTYWLVDVDNDGTHTIHDPVAVEATTLDGGGGDVTIFLPIIFK